MMKPSDKATARRAGKASQKSPAQVPAAAEKPKPGDTVEWPIRAQGSNRTGTGTAIAVGLTGGPPKDIWPKGKDKPTSRQLVGFTKVREKPYVIVEEKLPGGGVRYLTPPLHAPVTVKKK